jgi:hypothetical protein
VSALRGAVGRRLIASCGALVDAVCVCSFRGGCHSASRAPARTPPWREIAPPRQAAGDAWSPCAENGHRQERPCAQRRRDPRCDRAHQRAHRFRGERRPSLHVTTGGVSRVCSFTPTSAARVSAPSYTGVAHGSGRLWCVCYYPVFRPRVRTHPIRPHRPEAQDVALSRPKHGFESRWGRTKSPIEPPQSASERRLSVPPEYLP